MSAGYLSAFSTSRCLSEEHSEGTTSQTAAYLPENTGFPGLKNTTVSSSRQPFGRKKGLYGEMLESLTMPERLTAILSTPGVCVILRKHKCITSLWGQDESFSSHQ